MELPLNHHRQQSISNISDTDSQESDYIVTDSRYIPYLHSDPNVWQDQNQFFVHTHTEVINRQMCQYLGYILQANALCMIQQICNVAYELGHE